jgi:hypothetical protein
MELVVYIIGYSRNAKMAIDSKLLASYIAVPIKKGDSTMTLAEIVRWTDEAGRRTNGPGHSPITAKQRERLAELNRRAAASQSVGMVWVRKLTRPAVQLAACFVALFVRSHN